MLSFNELLRQIFGHIYHMLKPTTATTFLAKETVHNITARPLTISNNPCQQSLFVDIELAYNDCNDKETTVNSKLEPDFPSDESEDKIFIINDASHNIEGIALNTVYNHEAEEWHAIDLEDKSRGSDDSIENSFDSNNFNEISGHKGCISKQISNSIKQKQQPLWKRVFQGKLKQFFHFHYESEEYDSEDTSIESLECSSYDEYDSEEDDEDKEEEEDCEESEEEPNASPLVVFNPKSYLNV